MSDLEGSLKRSTLETSELHIHVRRHQENLKIKSDDVETSRRETDSIRDYLISADRKVSSLKNAVEEARSMLEQSDKCRRQLEQELAETQEEHAKLVFTNTAFDQEKRRLDADLAEAQVLTFTCTGCCKTTGKLWQHITETLCGVFLVFLGSFECQIWAIFHFGTLWA